MSTAKGLKVVGYFDCPGGGQVVVRDGVAYIGHVKPPNGTTLVDVSDPANPRQPFRDQGSRKHAAACLDDFRNNGNRTDHPVQTANGRESVAKFSAVGWQ